MVLGQAGGGGGVGVTGGSNNWLQAGSLCGQCLLSKQKPLKGE